ncbi:hypothetical protein FA95DRAFT_1610057 [Auriscalpium vulgare]|uniref:Uncharacterized protein n=1 Tax=Auriscalpium vulgare TaxID=40419 RepID=A0ACB8RFB0_9AGAM|nr:hypothetical protein FA95DRAFT_1610057 [Auriscalpium vulgare]
MHYSCNNPEPEEYSSDEDGEDWRHDSARQEDISETLQLINIFEVLPCEADRKYRKIPSSAEDREELAFLRAITTFAVGDSPLDQLAVTRCLLFSGDTFVFAMNRPALPADKARVQEFFQSTVEATDHRPYLSFALKNSPSLVRKQIKGLKVAIEGSTGSLEKLLEPCTGQDSGDLDELTAFLRPASFSIPPLIEDLRRADLRTLYLGVLKCLQSRVVDFQPSEDALVPFAEITSLAALLDSLAANPDLKTMVAALPCVQTLCDSVGTVARYALGAVAFLQSREKYIPDPTKVFIEWEHSFVLHFSDNLQPFDSINLPLSDVLESWGHAAPANRRHLIEERWTHDIDLVLHAEIRLFHFVVHGLTRVGLLAGDSRFRIGSSTDTFHATGRFVPDWANAGSDLFNHWEDDVQQFAEASLESFFRMLRKDPESHAGLVNKDSPSSDGEGPEPLEHAWLKPRPVGVDAEADRVAADGNAAFAKAMSIVHANDPDCRQFPSWTRYFGEGASNENPYSVSGAEHTDINASSALTSPSSSSSESSALVTSASSTLVPSRSPSLSPSSTQQGGLGVSGKEKDVRTV